MGCRRTSAGGWSSGRRAGDVRLCPPPSVLASAGHSGLVFLCGEHPWLLGVVLSDARVPRRKPPGLRSPGILVDGHSGLEFWMAKAVRAGKTRGGNEEASASKKS